MPTPFLPFFLRCLLIFILAGIASSILNRYIPVPCVGIIIPTVTVIAVLYIFPCTKLRIKNYIKRILRLLSRVIWIALAIWGMGVVYYCLPGGSWLFYVYLLILAFAFLERKRRFIRYIMVGIVLVINVFYLCIPATNDRPWLPSWSRLPYGQLDGNTLVIDGVRDFSYRTPDDFDVHYKTGRYDLDKLQSLYFAVCHWDGMKAVSHTMLSFGFEGGEYLALSAETRLAEGDKQGSLPGLFKQFGYQYLFATEPDIFALRTNYRHEDLYLYKVVLSPEKIRIILLDFVRRANALHEHPEFYNTLTHNCTTGLLPSVEKTLPLAHYNLSILLNGLLDRRMFHNGWLWESYLFSSFEKYKEFSRIPYDISKDDRDAYSRRIRYKRPPQEL